MDGEFDGEFADLAALLSRYTGLSLTVEGLAFEMERPHQVLDESPYHTQVDVGIHVRAPDGRPGLVLVEVKLSEAGFSWCNGFLSSRNHTQSVCCSNSLFWKDPRACYLTSGEVHSRRYWEQGVGQTSYTARGSQHLLRRTCRTGCGRALLRRS